MNKSLKSKKHLFSIYHPTLYLIALIVAFFFFSPLLSCKDQNKEGLRQKRKPERIVSLAPNITEILFSIGAGDRIVGVTSFCNYPAEALSKTKIGGFTNPNLEIIASLKPDLVIGTPNVGNREAILNLKRAIPADILLFQAENLEDFYKMIEGIGKATHEERNALNLNHKLRAEIERFRKKSSSQDRKKVLISLSIKPVISATQHSFPGMLATIAGANLIPSLPKSQGQINSYPIVSLEEIITLNPEIIIQTTMDSIDRASEIHLKRYWQQWSSIAAVQKQNIYVISGDLILRPSPRSVDGIELLFKLIHGESEIAEAKK